MSSIPTNPLNSNASGVQSKDAESDVSPQARAQAIIAGLDSDDYVARNASILELAKADADTTALVEIEVEKSVGNYDGPEDDMSDWRALDTEPFVFSGADVSQTRALDVSRFVRQIGKAHVAETEASAGALAKSVGFVLP